MIDVNTITGSTCWQFLAPVFVLHHTQKGSGIDSIYQTDRAGLAGMIRRADSAGEAINDAIKVVTKLLAYADRSEIEDDMTDLAWLLNGLAELRGEVDFARKEAMFGLERGNYLKDANHAKTQQ